MANHFSLNSKAFAFGISRVLLCSTLFNFQGPQPSFEVLSPQERFAILSHLFAFVKHFFKVFFFQTLSCSPLGLSDATFIFYHFLLSLSSAFFEVFSPSSTSRHLTLPAVISRPPRKRLDYISIVSEMCQAFCSKKYKNLIF